MKSKIVLWGTNEQDEKVLVAMELLAKENKVDLYVFPENLATEEFYNRMMNEWRVGQEVPFPEGYSKQVRELSITESLLPETLKVERGDVVQRAQTEWHFIVLSSKLNDAYQSELADIKEKIERLSKYDSGVWEELKQFWSKVQGQVRDRNLFREHADSLRDNTNALFAQMKELRASLDQEFQRVSKEQHDHFMNLLGEVEERINQNTKLQSIFEELKKMQRSFRETKLNREHRSKVWERLDKAFKTVKEKRFGPDAASGDNSPAERLKRRYDGLLAAIEKMEKSIKRDKNDLTFQNRKIAATDGQLEAQIRQAKIKMIEERIRSKEEKLGEMHQTREDLERRIAVQAERDAKRAEREKIEEAKLAAKAKIEAEIKAAEVAREGSSDKLEKAAESIQSKGTETAKDDAATKSEDTVMEAVAATVGESLEDVVDTVKAVAEVVSGRIGEAVKEFTESLQQDTSEEE